jgi:hypothetical protein
VGQVNDVVRVQIASFVVFAMVGDVAATYELFIEKNDDAVVCVAHDCTSKTERNILSLS